MAHFVPSARPHDDASYNRWFDYFHIDECGKPVNDPIAKRVIRADVATLICAYNEEWYALQRSLESLAVIPSKNSLFEPAICSNAMSMDVAVAIDGVEMLKPCMREYLKEIFGPDIPVDVDKEGNALAWPEIKEDGMLKPSEICIVNRRTHRGHLLSLILKRHNQKKINSHEWGFRAFGQMRQCKYILTTDCGILFDSKCIFHLYRYMEANEGCVACTGRGRVMSAEQQANPNHEHKNDSIVESMLRRVQLYEYEGEYLTLKPAGSMLGFMEVLPGPCAFFRRKEIEGAPLDEYFDMGQKRPRELGLLLSNLKIAEDRITSWSAVWLGHGAKYSAWVDDALFFIDAELTIMDLLLQRRRWLNGNLSGSLFVLSRCNLLFGSKNSLWMKLSCSAMAIIQVAAFVMSLLSVAYFGGAFHMSIDFMQHTIGFSKLIPHYMTATYFTIYILLVFFHSKKWEHDQRFSHTLWTISFVVNGLLVIMSLISMSLYYSTVVKQILHCFTKSNNGTTNIESEIGNQCWTYSSIHSQGLLKFIVVACLASIPIFNALLSNTTSVCIILNPLNMLVSMLALPTYKAFFSAYAISRYSDLTWGQRPTIDPQCQIQDNESKCSRCNQPCAQGHEKYCEDHIWLHKKVRHCKWIAYLLVILNVGAMTAVSYVSPVILIAVTFVNGTIQQTLALTRTLAKWVKRLYKMSTCKSPYVSVA